MTWLGACGWRNALKLDVALRGGEANAPAVWGEICDVLSPEWAARYWSGPGVFAAGDMFGFEVNYTENPDPGFVLLSNAIEGPMRRRFNRLGRELGQLRK